jgi:molybdopterin synthase sulfur carrier subunit
VSVLVKFFAGLRGITGCREADVPPEPDVRALLHALSARYGFGMRAKLLSGDGLRPGPEIIILVNGRHLEHIGGIETPLQPGDVVLLFPVVAGG